MIKSIDPTDSNPLEGLDCNKNSKVPCSTTFKWMYDCSKIPSNSGITKADCEQANRGLVLSHVLDLCSLLFPFGAAYGDWLGGVSDPDLNLTIKAMTGSFVIDLILQMQNSKAQDKMPHAILSTLAVGGWVLMSQIVQDFVFHGAPNRFIGSAVAGLANYYRTVGKLPFKITPTQTGGLVIFSTAMSSFAGNWSMMGDNLLSRFMSTTFAVFLSYFSAINGTSLQCVFYHSLYPKVVLQQGLQLGVGTALAGTVVQSAIGKPVVSGLAAGFAGLKIAEALFNGDDWKKCHN